MNFVLDLPKCLLMKCHCLSTFNIGGPEVDCLSWVDAVLDRVDLSCSQTSWQTWTCLRAPCAVPPMIQVSSS